MGLSTKVYPHDLGNPHVNGLVFTGKSQTEAMVSTIKYRASGKWRARGWRAKNGVFMWKWRTKQLCLLKKSAEPASDRN